MTSVDVEVGTVSIGDPAAVAKEVNWYNASIAAAVPLAKPITVTPAFGMERGVQTAAATAPDRLVVFAARSAELLELDATAAPSGRNIFAISEALLDVVDELPRYSAGTADQLPRAGTPRRGLFSSELLSGPQEMKALLYRRSVTLVPRSMTSASGHAFEVRPTDRIADREQMVDTWLPQIASGAGNPPAAELCRFLRKQVPVNQPSRYR